MKIILVLLCLVITFYAGVADAEMSAKDVVDNFEKGDLVTGAFVKGIEDGIGWAEVYREKNGESQIFCQPRKLALTPDQDAEIVSKYISNNPKLADAPFGLVLLMAFRETFPCQK
jgi:hypothetical protein